MKKQKKEKKNLVARKKSSTFALAKQDNILSPCYRSGFSAVGSAHVWGARGRWFESSNPDRKKGNVLIIKQLPFFRKINRVKILPK